MSDHKICEAQGCPRAVPYERRWDAKYCSNRCKWREKQREYRKKKEGLDDRVQ